MLKSMVLKGLRAAGYELQQKELLLQSLTSEDREIIRAVSDKSMIGDAGLIANLDAVAYVVANRIAGAVVECGVWRGGSIMAMAMKLIALGDTSRNVYLFDTFEGMTAPSDLDVSYTGQSAHRTFLANQRAEGINAWRYASLEDVRANLLTTGYPSHRLHFVKGDVAETIPATPLGEIAVLRLDTDWYESTRIELEYYFERISHGGVLIIDDYGHWTGARKAVDEYFDKCGIQPLLFRIDYTRRMMIKTF